MKKGMASENIRNREDTARKERRLQWFGRIMRNEDRQVLMRMYQIQVEGRRRRGDLGEGGWTVLRRV